MKIKDIKTKIIKNSREEEIIKVELLYGESISVSASVPQGKSTGEKEAISLNAEISIQNIKNIITPLVIDKEFSSQEDFDNFLINLDGTENKSHLGANTILALSLAFARATAKLQDKPLYRYISDITNLEVGLPNV